MTTTETLAAMRSLNLDPQTKNIGMSGWTCEIWIHGKLKTTHAKSEAEAVRRAWVWLRENPVGEDNWGAS